jgi:hypothetical protein
MSMTVHNQKIGDVQDLVLDKDGRVAHVGVDVGSVLGDLSVPFCQARTCPPERSLAVECVSHETIVEAAVERRECERTTSFW